MNELNKHFGHIDSRWWEIVKCTDSVKNTHEPMSYNVNKMFYKYLISPVKYINQRLGSEDFQQYLKK